MQRELIRFLLIGIVSAWIASIVTRGRIIRVRGCLVFLIFGVLGSITGGYVLHMFGLSDVASVVAAGVGAIGSLVFLQMLRNA